MSCQGAVEAGSGRAAIRMLGGAWMEDWLTLRPGGPLFRTREAEGERGGGGRDVGRGAFGCQMPYTGELGQVSSARSLEGAVGASASKRDARRRTVCARRSAASSGGRPVTRDRGV